MIGIDFGFFQNRISGEVDYYIKNTKDLLLNVPVPATTGYSIQTQNIGSVQNKGYESVLNTSNLTGELKWNTQYGLVNLFRLAEMYLIRAECNQRLRTAVGDTPLNDYNIIHKRAGLPAASSVTLNAILLERRLELAHEGFKIHDIRRLKLNTGPLTYKDPRLVFPIPEREISANPALKGQQNEGY